MRYTNSATDTGNVICKSQTKIENECDILIEFLGIRIETVAQRVDPENAENEKLYKGIHNTHCVT